MLSYKVGEPIDIVITEEGNFTIRVEAKKLNSSMPFIECIGESIQLDELATHLTITNLSDPGKYYLRIILTDENAGRVVRRNQLIEVLVDTKEDIIISALKDLKQQMTQGDSSDEEIKRMLENIFINVI